MTHAQLLDRLVEGAPGKAQPSIVRGRLRELERAELIQYQESGWHLTGEGQALLADSRLGAGTKADEERTQRVRARLNTFWKGK